MKTSHGMQILPLIITAFCILGIGASCCLNAQDVEQRYTANRVVSIQQLLAQLDLPPRTSFGINGTVSPGGYIEITATLVINDYLAAGRTPIAKNQDIFHIVLNQTSHDDFSYNTAIDIPLVTKNSTDQYVPENAHGDNIKEAVLLLKGLNSYNPAFGGWEGLHEEPQFFSLADVIWETLTGVCGMRAASSGNYPVVVSARVKNAHFTSCYIPGIGLIKATEFHKPSAPAIHNNSDDNPADIAQLGGALSTATGAPPLIINVYRGENGTKVSTTSFMSPTDISYMVNPNGKGWHYLTRKDTIGCNLGDVIEIYAKKNSSAKPTLNGLPAVWLSGFANSMQFISSPNVRPGEFQPFIPWESSVHMKNFNKYPPDFQINVPDWQQVDVNGISYWYFRWTIQREQSRKKTFYNAQIEFPKTKTYKNGKVQRDDQGVGNVEEFLHYWRLGHGTGNTYTPTISERDQEYQAPTYTMTLDGDEVVYNGSYIMEQNPIVTPGLTFLGAPTFGTSNDLVNWQNLWPEEKLEKSYTPKGYPGAGFALNDYITEYRAYKERARGNHAKLPNYDGYLIEDYGAWRAEKINGDPIVREDGKPGSCRGCRFNPTLATRNVTNPGDIEVVIDGTAYKFRMSAHSPVMDDDGLSYPFYNVIKGTNTPLGWCAKTKYTVEGLSNLSDDQLKALRLDVLYYQIGGGKPTVFCSPGTNIDFHGGTTFLAWSGRIDDSQISEIRATGKWVVDVPLEHGFSGLALRFENFLGERAFLGGRPLMVMDPPLNHISAPGSKPQPYDQVSLVNGGIDLAEGEGERPGEYISQWRAVQDPLKGYLWGQPAAAKYAKRYTLNKGNKLTLSAKDVGVSKVQIFNASGPPHLLTYYDQSRVMLADTVAKNLTYTVRRVVDEYTWNSGAIVHAQSGERHFTYTWNEPGLFEVEVTFMGSDYKTFALVKVVDYPSNCLDETQMNTNIKRGNIKFRPIRAHEVRHLIDYRNKGFEYSDEVYDHLHNAFVASIDDVLSEYKFVKGPRATSYGDRFGDFNDFNNHYEWDITLKPGMTEPRDNYVVRCQIPENAWTPETISETVFPAAWKNIFIRHTSSNYFPKEEIEKSAVRTEQASTTYTDLCSNIYSKLEGPQAKYGPLRWLPWFSKTPTSGYKIARFNKGITKLTDFFNGTGNNDGAWSGQPYIDLPFIQNAVSEDSPISDDDLNFLEFFYDIAYGRKFIVIPSLFTVDAVYNLNPRKHAHDENLPDRIYMAGNTIDPTPRLTVNLMENLFYNSYRVFAMARRADTGLYQDLTNIDGSEYNISSPAANGMGLISLCIANRMAWEASAESMAEQTLKTLTNHLLHPSKPDLFKLAAPA
ncbi:MAG: hypothetical protein ACOYXT_23535, partial [Bacteroidota bacterium]